MGSKGKVKYANAYFISLLILITVSIFLMILLGYLVGGPYQFIFYILQLTTASVLNLLYMVGFKSVFNNEAKRNFVRFILPAIALMVGTLSIIGIPVDLFNWLCIFTLPGTNLIMGLYWYRKSKIKA